MNVVDIDKVQTLLSDLKNQREKLDQLDAATSIHVAFAGPNMREQHLHFDIKQDCFNLEAITNNPSNWYCWSDALKFVTEVLNDRIQSCTDMLSHYGVEINGQPQ